MQLREKLLPVKEWMQKNEKEKAITGRLIDINCPFERAEAAFNWGRRSYQRRLSIAVDGHRQSSPHFWLLHLEALLLFLFITCHRLTIRRSQSLLSECQECCTILSRWVIKNMTCTKPRWELQSRQQERSCCCCCCYFFEEGSPITDNCRTTRQLQTIGQLCSRERLLLQTKLTRSAMWKKDISSGGCDDKGRSALRQRELTVGTGDWGTLVT